MISFNFLLTLVLYVAIVIVGIVQCDIFNSQVELDSLFQIHIRVVDSLNNYLKNEELRIQELKLTQKVFETIENSYKENLLQNPVNAFVVIKTLTKDLSKFLNSAEEQTKNFNSLLSIINEIKQNKIFPYKEDVKGAVLAINRLQDTYKFEISQMSNGLLGTHCCSLRLQVDDFFELGKQSFELKDFPHTLDWMNQVLFILNKANNNSTEAIDLLKIETNKILTEAQQILATLNQNQNHLHTNFNSNYNEDELNQDKEYLFLKLKYEALCRGEIKTNHANSKLKCYYSTRKNHYLLIAPVKEEILNFSPLIVLFHDVLHDSEIEIIKILAKPNFETATVTVTENVTGLTGDIEVSNNRVSKVAWIEEADDPIIRKINERIKIISQLDLKTAEDLQVSNYGIGGHYEPHYDFSHVLEPDEGNRIATFMFYMSSVEGGGGTVFPHLNIAVQAVKGSALFWFNLLENGDVDLRTLHGACPVLLGSKWVSNKWIHERGQEFKRPCN